MLVQVFKLTKLIRVLCSLTAIPEMLAYLLTPGKEN